LDLEPDVNASRAIVRGVLHPFEVALRRPLETSAGRIESRRGVLLRLVDRAGRVGLGEASPFPARVESPEEDVLACDEALAEAIPALGGMDPVERLDGLALPDAVPPAARFALESALVDLAAQARGLRAADWLAGGRAFRDPVIVNALIAGADAEAVRAGAEEALALGYETFKLKVGFAGVGEDTERLESLRRTVGKAARIRVDANGAWSPEVAREALRELERFDLEFVEDPIAVGSVDDVADLGALRGSSPVPIAVDEATARPPLIAEVLEQKAADRLVLKPAAIGGLLASRRLAGAAHRLGIGCVVTSNLDAAVGLAASLHLAASLEGELAACGLGTASWLARDVATPLPVRGGRMHLPEGAGLGVVLADPH
jgi:o-succinylbenzoate synthase